jgi:hypothetical protein
MRRLFVYTVLLLAALMPTLIAAKAMVSVGPLSP